MAKRARSGGKKAEPSFKRAIEMAEHLELVPGLGALKKGEGRDRIRVGAGALLGSVNIDDNCRAAYSQDHRWDYVIGARRSRAEVAIFVEVHSAETSEVSKMEHKLSWLQSFLRRDQQTALAALPREIYWVASGRVNIPKHLPQYKKLQTTLRAQGLLGPVTQLDLP
jgi:hypothetical protein